MKSTLTCLTKILMLVVLIVAFQVSDACGQTFNFQTWNSSNQSVMTVNAFRSVTIDRRGIVWAGSDLGGLYYLQDTSWFKVSTYPDITFRHIVPSNMPADSNVWATSIGKSGVQAISGGAYYINTQTKTVTQYGSGFNNGGLSSRYGNSLAMSTNGKTYVALAQSINGTTTNQGGVYAINTSNPPAPSTNPFTKAIPDVGDISYQSAGNRGDELWFGRIANCSGGCVSPDQAPYIARLSSQGIRLPSITAANSPLPFTPTSASSFARAIFTDTITGNTFVGLSSGGIGVYKLNGTWKLLTSSNSPFPSGAAVNFNAIAGVYGEVWIGTTSGVFVYNGSGSLDSMNSFKLLTTANGLPFISITDIAVDTARSQIWVTSLSGVSRATYVPPSIKGVVYNVFLNKEGKTTDSLDFLYPDLQREPLMAGVKVRLLENGVEKENTVVDADGVFELKKAEDGKLYTVEVRYKKGEREIIYKYPETRNHMSLGAILIPDKLIEEVKFYKTQLQKKCFGIDTKLTIKINLCLEEFVAFDVTDYDKSYEVFYSVDGISKNHKRQVNNLADFYTSVATVYKLGDYSNELLIEGFKAILPLAESITGLSTFHKMVQTRITRFTTDEVKDKVVKTLIWSSIKAYKEVVMPLIKAQLTNNLNDQVTAKNLERIKEIFEEITDNTLAVIEKGAEAGPKIGLALLNNVIVSGFAPLFYRDYTKNRHEKFVMNAATSSRDALSNLSFEEGYNRLYNPYNNSLHGAGKNTLDIKKSLIKDYKASAKYASLAGDIVGSATVLGIIPGGQIVATSAKLLSYAAKGLSTYYLGAAIYQGVFGGAQIANTSYDILPTVGFRSRQQVGNIAYRSNISTDSLVLQKNIFHQRLSELNSLYAATYDSAAFFAKLVQYNREDSIYNLIMTRTLNSMWASADSASKQINGFPTMLNKVIDSFITKQYVFRNSFAMQNVALIFDSVKTGYAPIFDSLITSIKFYNDSAVSGIVSLANDIISNNIVSPAYLIKESYNSNHTHLPGSNGTITYTFKNYGTEPQSNVSFKISKPTGGYTITSADSIFIGTILGGETKTVSYSFTSPINDSVGTYTINVKASNGRFSSVTGSLYVNEPLKFYSEKAGNWSDPNTWSTKAIPVNTSKVMVTHNVTVDTDGVCNSLEIVIPGNLVINPGKVLKVLN